MLQSHTVVDMLVTLSLNLTDAGCRKELAKEVSDLLMGAAEGARSMVDANDRLILNVEVARIFGSLGYERKAAFFSRQVAQLYLQQEGQWSASSALQVLALGAKTYNIQSNSSRLKRDEPDVVSPYLEISNI